MIDHDPRHEQSATFVWSKLRARYHAPDCRWVRRILPANWRAGETPEPLDGEPRAPCKVCEPSSAAAAGP